MSALTDPRWLQEVCQPRPRVLLPMSAFRAPSGQSESHKCQQGETSFPFCQACSQEFDGTVGLSYCLHNRCDSLCSLLRRSFALNQLMFCLCAAQSPVEKHVANECQIAHAGKLPSSKSNAYSRAIRFLRQLFCQECMLVCNIANLNPCTHACHFNIQGKKNT